jgi:hypothetical protein
MTCAASAARLELNPLDAGASQGEIEVVENKFHRRKRWGGVHVPECESNRWL